MISASNSGWNCTPQAFSPMRKACVRLEVVAREAHRAFGAAAARSGDAPRGASKRCGKSCISGSSAAAAVSSTCTVPISMPSGWSPASPPSASASNWWPKQMPSTGVPWRPAAQARRRWLRSRARGARPSRASRSRWRPRSRRAVAACRRGADRAPRPAGGCRRGPAAIQCSKSPRRSRSASKVSPTLMMASGTRAEVFHGPSSCRTHAGATRLDDLDRARNALRHLCDEVLPLRRLAPAQAHAAGLPVGMAARRLRGPDQIGDRAVGRVRRARRTGARVDAVDGRMAALLQRAQQPELPAQRARTARGLPPSVRARRAACWRACGPAAPSPATPRRRSRRPAPRRRRATGRPARGRPPRRPPRRRPRPCRAGCRRPSAPRDGRSPWSSGLRPAAAALRRRRLRENRRARAGRRRSAAPCRTADFCRSATSRWRPSASREFGGRRRAAHRRGIDQQFGDARAGGLAALR